MEVQELLFYGGIAVMATAVLFGAAAFVFFRLRAARLKRQLDREYGVREKRTEKAG